MEGRFSSHSPILQKISCELVFLGRSMPAQCNKLGTNAVLLLHGIVFAEVVSTCRKVGSEFMHKHLFLCTLLCSLQSLQDIHQVSLKESNTKRECCFLVCFKRTYLIHVSISAWSIQPFYWCPLTMSLLFVTVIREHAVFSLNIIIGFSICKWAHDNRGYSFFPSLCASYSHFAGTSLGNGLCPRHIQKYWCLIHVDDELLWKFVAFSQSHNIVNESFQFPLQAGSFCWIDVVCHRYSKWWFKNFCNHPSDAQNCGFGVGSVPMLPLDSFAFHWQLHHPECAPFQTCFTFLLWLFFLSLGCSFNLF